MAANTECGLREEGWSSVWTELNAYTADYFREKNIDAEHVKKFLDLEADDLRLVSLSVDHDFDYALEQQRRIDGS